MSAGTILNMIAIAWVGTCGVAIAGSIFGVFFSTEFYSYCKLILCAMYHSSHVSIIVVLVYALYYAMYTILFNIVSHCLYKSVNYSVPFLGYG